MIVSKITGVFTPQQKLLLQSPTLTGGLLSVVICGEKLKLVQLGLFIVITYQRILLGR